jgi:hypothetical protein
MIYIYNLFSSLSHFNRWHIEWHSLRFFTHPYSTQHQLIWSRHRQVKCRYFYWLQSFLLISLHRATINHCFIHLFFSFAARTYNHSFSHLPESRTRTDKREKLMLRARSQSACRLLLSGSIWEDDNRRSFLRSLIFSSRLSHLFLRPSILCDERANRRTSFYMCMYVCACLCLQSYEQADVFSSSAYTPV